MKIHIVILTALFMLSCAPSGDGPEPPAPVPPAALSTLDQSLVTCRADGDCPRGAHCALGACAYECAHDADCVHGRTCDATGRCR